jgi:HD-like signal output (HDOD) protein
MRSLQEWVKALGGYDIPVLRETVSEINRMRADEDRVTARDVADVTLRDPLMTLRVLRFSQARLTSRQPTEVTTVEHALMMHGLANFFRQLREPRALEDTLAAAPHALSGARHVLSRAYHAAINARNFAALRHDLEGEEVTVSALLHDLAEILLWCVAPPLAMQIEHMLLGNRSLRSASAQRAVLGFTLGELQIALTKEWRLPRLLQDLMDDRKAQNPRVLTVRASVALARHSAHGWDDPALPDDYAALQRLTALPPDQLARWVRQCALQAARKWTWFGVRPAAAWLPLLPGDWPASAADCEIGEPRAALIGRVIDQLSQCARPQADVATVIALVFYALQQGIGLRRLWFGTIAQTGGRVEARQTLLLDPGLMPADLSFDLAACHLFAKLMERPQGVWCNPTNQTRLAPLLPGALAARAEKSEFFATSIHVRGTPYALLYADCGSRNVAFDEGAYSAFKQLGTATRQALERVTG